LVYPGNTGNNHPSLKGSYFWNALTSRVKV
jgi:hypothetical protein